MVVSRSATLEVPEADMVVQGRDEIVVAVSGALTGATTTHHGHMPEIDITGVDRDDGGYWRARAPDASQDRTFMYSTLTKRDAGSPGALSTSVLLVGCLHADVNPPCATRMTAVAVTSASTLAANHAAGACSSNS